MKKVIQTIVAALMSVAFMGSFASAASCDGVITLTGPESNNTIKCSDVNDLVLKCNNNVYVANVNYQNGSSGDAEVGGNTSAGTAVSGNVTNDNGQNVQLGTSCNSAVVTPATTETPVGGAGATTPPPAETPAPGVGAAMLPYTASSPLAATVIGSLAAAAIVFGASRLGVAVYRRLGSK